MKLCSKDASVRYTTTEALKHPWITRSFEVLTPLNCQKDMHEYLLRKKLMDMMTLGIFLSQISKPSLIKVR